MNLRIYINKSNIKSKNIKNKTTLNEKGDSENKENILGLNEDKFS